ncbi:MAG: Asp-tRNA(Asn)/Glu-tRNA(Gln) amidotransferase A subunit family amidase [Gammaproteobacteria bacterium]
MKTKLNELGMAELARKISTREISAEAVMTDCLDRVQQREIDVGAFNDIDEEAALESARRADRKEITGALHGIPFAAKDIIDTERFTTEWGTEFYKGYSAGRNASCVELFLQAGAILVGKTVTTEFAYFKPGKTANPNKLEHTPGGSSSGSAAAVADCMLPFAFGSQTAASLIRPAAYCGIPGYKASHGSFDLQGIMSLSPSLDTLGFLARQIEDFELARSVLCKSQPADAIDHENRPLRISLFRGPHWNEGSMEMRDVCQRAMKQLSNAGAVTGELACPESFLELTEHQKTVMAFEVARSRVYEYNHYRDEISPQFRDLFETGLEVSRADYVDGCLARDRANRILQTMFLEADVILTPAAPGEAPAGLGATGDPLFSRAWNLLQVPCISVPFGQGPNGLPLSVQLVGAINQDDKLLAAAQWIEGQLRVGVMNNVDEQHNSAGLNL